MLQLALQWDYNLNDCLVAVGFGIVSGALCVTAVIMLGVFRQLFNRIRDRVNRNTKIPGVIVAAVIGGIIVGTVGWVLPLTIGDGNMACAAIIRLTNQQLQSDNGNPYSEDGHMTIHLLLSVLFMKLFCLGVSMNCGFVGGFVFPMITVGACAGSAAALYYPNQPIGLCVGCFLGAVPAGICPMPFTMLGIAVYSFYFGLYQTVPIYVAIITSYMVVCGSGLFRKLADRGDEAALLRKQELEEENDMRISNLNDTVDIKDNDAGYKPPKIPSTFDRNSFAFDKYGKKNTKGSNIKGESSSLTASLIDN